MKSKILIIEDDREINHILTELLSRNGYRTSSAFNGAEASEIMRNQNFDMILMDLMLPEKSGEELIRELRSYSESPIIVISAKSMLETRIEVLRLGADDYILKPFDISEVLVRIEVVLRRSMKSEYSTDKVLEYNGLKLYSDENRVLYNDTTISLTAKELLLLRLFMEYPKKVYTKANLYESVWNSEYFYEDNTINVHVSNLRSKLKKISGLDFIETVWGIGYRLREI
ncbi:MAG: response regulator transcription factor [Ruminococcus sp.]|nr:response regulator transcription factor [Ruminococcus sp.]